MSGTSRQDPEERRSVLSYLREAERFGRRAACRWREGVRVRERSWGELIVGSRKAARLIADHGIGAGGGVLIQGPNGGDWIEALLGCFLLGAVAVPLDEETGPDFRARVAGVSGARVLVAPPGTEPPEAAARIILGEWRQGEAGPLPEALPEPDAGDRAEVVFTSGTTGDPKGVVLTHGNLMAALRGIERGYRKRERWIERLAPLPFVSTLPLSHMFGQALSVFIPMMMGLSVVFAPPRPAEVREASRASKAWGIFCVPRLMDLLARDLRRDLRASGREAAFDERHRRWRGRNRWMQALAHRAVQRRFGWRMRLFVVGGAPMPGDLRSFWDEMGYLVVVGYGLTETAPIVSISNPFERGSESVGRPARNQEVRIGPEGEVLVRGPNVSPGYVGGGDGGAFEDGWFHTGDVGEMDEGGRLRIRGRLKEVIVTPEGENVHARDVEAALDSQAGVREAAVIGIPAGKGAGERVHAVLLMEPGGDASGAVAAANGILPARARIRGHTVWPEADLPRTPTGKVRKVALAAAVRALQEEGDAAAVEGLGAVDVRAVIAGVAGVAPGNLAGTTSLVEGLGLGSLDLVEVAAALEGAFGVPVSEEVLQGATVGDLEALVREEAIPAAPAPARARAEDEKQGEPAPGSLRMPRWAARPAVQIFRRMLQEAVLFPFVRFYARPEVRGLGHVEGLDAPFLLVADHHSHFDTELLKAVLPARLGGRLAPAMTTRHQKVLFGEAPGTRRRYLREWYQVRILQLFFHAWPLPETAGFRRSLRYAGELADRGFSLLIFPQGHLVPEEEAIVFRQGIGIFARELGLPVVPARIEGTWAVLPPRTRWPRRGRTRVTFGEPLRFAPGDDPAGISSALESAVRAPSGRDSS